MFFELIGGDFVASSCTRNLVITNMVQRNYDGHGTEIQYCTVMASVVFPSMLCSTRCINPLQKKDKVYSTDQYRTLKTQHATSALSLLLLRPHFTTHLISQRVVATIATITAPKKHVNRAISKIESKMTRS